MTRASRSAFTLGPAAALLASILPLGGCRSGAPDAQLALRPPPTEHWLSADAESENKQKRKAWIESLHRAPPDVDWKLIERRNGEQQREKRNRLAAMAAVTSRWTERGSANQAGRMHAAVRGTDGQTLMARRWAACGAARSTAGLTPSAIRSMAARWLAVVPGASPADQTSSCARPTRLIDVTRDDGYGRCPACLDRRRAARAHAERRQPRCCTTTLPGSCAIRSIATNAARLASVASLNTYAGACGPRATAGVIPARAGQSAPS
jgi:hypothetical protein